MKCLKYATVRFCFTLFLPFEKKSEQHSWFVLFLQLGIGMGQGIFDFLKLIYQVQKSIIYLVSTGLLDTLKIYRNCCCFPSQVNFFFKFTVVRAHTREVICRISNDFFISWCRSYYIHFISLISSSFYKLSHQGKKCWHVFFLVLNLCEINMNFK